MRIVVRAREHAAHHWSPTHIRALLASEFGLSDPPAISTIQRWCDPAQDARQRRERREHARRKRAEHFRFTWPGTRTPEWKLGRVRVLHDAGLSCAAIAIVMTVDFPDVPLTARQVRTALRDGATPYSGWPERRETRRAA